MLHATSNLNPGAELVNPFFTRAQLYAFQQDPPSAALKQVDVGSGQKAEYLEGEYIRLTLNMLIGQGGWDLKTNLIAQDVRTVQKAVYENGRRTNKTEDAVGVSATIHTSLVIYARDGSDRTRVYEATTVGDGMAAVGKGISDPLDKAIKSAETDGLKRCAINLGPVFGLDLKKKVKAKPLTIAHFEHLLRQRALREMEQSGQAQLPAGEPLRLSAPAEQTPSEGPAVIELVPEPVSCPQPATPTAESDPQPAAPAQAENRPDATAPADRHPRAQTQAPQPSPPEAVAQAPSERPASAPTNAATPPPAANDPDFQPWELSIIPTTSFEEWLRCIKTMAHKVSLMANPRELENFERRYKNLIAALPILPGEGQNPPRNFQARWNTIVEKRRQEFAQAA